MIRFVILLSTSSGIYVYCQTIRHSATTCHRLRQNQSKRLASKIAALNLNHCKQDLKT